MDDKNAGYSDDKELKKMRFLFSLGRELDEVDMSVDELMTILSGDSRHAKVDIAGTEAEGILKDYEELQGLPKHGEDEVDRILKDDKEVRELPKHGEDKVDDRSSTVAQPKKIGGSISHVNRLIHDHLRRTALANDLTELEKDRIEMIFFEAQEDNSAMRSATAMQNTMTYRLGKNIDIKLVYSLRSCYNKHLKNKGHSKRKHKITPRLSRTDKDGSIRNLITDMLNDGVMMKNIVKMVKKDKGVDITKEQVRYIKKQRDAKKM